MRCHASLEPGLYRTFGGQCSGQPLTCGLYSYVSSMQWGGSGGLFPSEEIFYVGNAELRMKGNLGARCFRISGSGKGSSDAYGSYVETQVAGHLRW